MENTNNPEVEVESQVETQPEVEGSGQQLKTKTEGISEQEESTQPQEDVQEQDEPSFTDKVDPEELSPELKKIYKSMQSDYTKKTKTLKEIQQDYQKAKQAEYYLSQLMNDKSFQRWRENYLSMSQAGDNQEKEQEPDFDAMTEEEKYQYFAKKAADETEQRLREEFNKTYGTFMNASLQEKASNIISNFKKEHPETNDNELAKLAPIIKKHNLTLEQAYAMTYPDRVGKAAVEKARKELYVKKKANLETGNLPGEAAPSSPSKPSFKEALEMARREQQR